MSFSRSAALWRQGRVLASAVRLSAAGKTGLWDRLPRPPPSWAAVSTSVRRLGEEEQQKEPEETAHAVPDSTPSVAPPTDHTHQSTTHILEASLPFVPELGWSVAAIGEGARSLGLVGGSEKFPRGGGELVDHFEQQCNQQLVAFMEDQTQLKGSKMLRSVIEHRLKMLIPYMEKWPQAMALKAFPANVPSALRNLALMVDDVWYCAGDRSTDFNWYSKRALLTAIYCSTEVYMVQDSSVDFQDTWNFLDRRMDDSATFGKARQQVEDAVWSGAELLSAGITTAQNMLGLNSVEEDEP